MARLLGRVASLSNAVDEKLLDCLQGDAVFTQAPDYGGVDLLEGLVARLTLGGVLGTEFNNDLVSRHTVLHVDISPPC